MAQPKGQRGSWFATWDGEALPCVHRHWWKGRAGYNDPYARPDDPKFVELVAAIRSLGRVIVTDDKLLDGKHDFQRTGYVGIWSIANVEFDASGLRFEFTRPLVRFDG